MKKSEYFFPTIIFFVLSIVLSGMFVLIEKKTIVENQERHLYVAANQANIMKDSVDTAIARVYTFSALIRDNQGNTKFFDKESKKIYEEIVVDSGIPLKNVAIAPEGVVEKVYPLAGNEQLVGFDFMDTTKEGNTEAVEAYQRGDVVVTNPFSLVQGGMGMAGRLPVFVENEGNEKFWGLVTVTLDFDQMIQSFHLNNLSEQKINYRLWYENTDGELAEMTASKKDVKNPVTYDFQIQNLKWHLDVEPAAGWQNELQIVIALIGIFVFSIMIALLILDKNRIKYANARLEQLAHLDGLTSCYSRHYVNTILVDQQTGAWTDKNVKYALAIVDIDYFKAVNDTYGHEVGDKAILAVSQVLKDSIRQMNGDCVIRHGGDEFIVLWNNITRERFLQKLNEIVNAVRLISFPDYPGLHLSISVGGEYDSTGKDDTYYEMTKRADKKLYEAKKKGKNQYIA